MEAEGLAFEVGARPAMGKVQIDETTTAATEVIRRGSRRGAGRRERPARLSSPETNLASGGQKMFAVALLMLVIHLDSPTGSLGAHQAPGSPPSAVQQRQQVGFAEPESANITQRVAVGRPVRFKCVVNNIGEHKVAWFNKDRHILLAIDNKTIAWRERIQVSSQADSVFVLQIDSVQLSDKGHYICQLNTQPTKSLTHTLDVVMPPQIREQETTVNIEPVKEFSPVELRCVADGIPEPVIKWRRESQTFELADSDEGDAPDEGGPTDANELDAGRSRLQNDDHDDGDDTAGARRRSVAGAAEQIVGSSRGTQMAPRTTKLSLDSTGATTGGERDGADFERDKSNAESKFIVKRHSSGRRLPPSFGQAGEPDQVSAPSVAPESFEADEEAPRRGPLMMAPKRRPAIRAAKSADGLDETTTTAAARNPASTSAGSAARPFLAEGEVLRIDRVSRYDMGHYMCIASNGVPPSVAQRIFLPVSYVSPPPRNSAANQTSTMRLKENNGGDARSSGGQNSAGSISAGNQQQHQQQDKSARVQTDKLPPTAPPNWAGSGRSYQRHRQHKAARASAASSSAGGRTLGLGSVVTATNGALLALLAALGIGLVIYLSGSCWSGAPKRRA